MALEYGWTHRTIREEFSWRQLELYIARRNERLDQMREAVEGPKTSDVQNWSTRWAMAAQDGEITKVVGKPNGN